jgi:uncharacterized protein (UPF0276 family)
VEADAVVAVAVAGADVMNSQTDRFGLGWRPELAAGIFDHLDQIDLVEVIADDYFAAPPRDIQALKTLSSTLPLVFHGVGMGLASTAPVQQRCLDSMARLCEQVRPELWSEHLAFVRAGGIEIDHLAAPPRTPQNVEATANNILRAVKAIGSKPQLENIATLIDPPGSLLSEPAWINSILAASDCDLLLDLHNILANGLNHGYDPSNFLAQISPSRIRSIHIAGGKFISAPDGSTRLLDDHLHDVPDPVFDLLEETAAISPNPLIVILERDGDFPSMSVLLAQMRQAGQAVTRGRAGRLTTAVSP